MNRVIVEQAVNGTSAESENLLALREPQEFWFDCAFSRSDCCRSFWCFVFARSLVFHAAQVKHTLGMFS